MATISGDYSTNLISHWKLDETSGTREDAHGNNDLTDNNTVGYATGKQSNAADFESDNSEYLSITDAAQSGIDTAFEGSAWTINMWIYPETLANKGLFAKANQYNGIACVFNTNWVQCFADPNNTDTDINFNSVTWSTGEWQMLTISHDSDNCRIYKNGSLSQTVNVANGAMQANSSPFILGASYWTSVQNHFDGLIDEVSLWSKKLSDADVTAIYNSGNGITYAAVAAGPASLKTRDTIAKASVKTIDGIAIASVKTIDTIA